MTRHALLISCAIHGCVLAVAGWSTRQAATSLSLESTEISVSLGSGGDALVVQDFPVARIEQPEAPSPSDEPGFAPPAPMLEPAAPVLSGIMDMMPPASAPMMPRQVPSMSLARKEPGSSSHPAKASGSARRASGSAFAAIGNAGAGGAGFVPPAFLLRYKPPYPEQARSRHLEGVVLLLASVDINGRVSNATIRQSCGHALLDRAALEAVRSWRFSPARQGDNTVPAIVEIPIRFTFSA